MRPHRIYSLLAIAAILLAGCAGATSTSVMAPSQAIVPTATSVATAAVAAPTVTSAAALTFPHTACAKGVDLTGQTVTLYHLVDPQVPPFQGQKAGFDDAAAYFNAHGGICGATVAQGYPDLTRAYDPQAEFTRLLALSPRPVLLTISDSGHAEQLRNQFAQEQIPVLGIRIGSVLATYGQDSRTPGWIFVTNPLYPDQLGAFCRFVSEHPQQYPHPIIGYLSWNSTSFGAAAYTPETIAYCASQGIKILDRPLYFAQNATDVQALVQQLIDSGANILFTNSQAAGPAAIAKALTEMKPQQTAALASVSWGLDASVGLLGQATLGADGLPSTNGLIGSLLLRTWSEADQLGIQLIAEQADLQQRPLSLRNNFYILGWATTDLYVELYIQTGNRVGFDHITGAEIKKTLENIVYSPLGGIETIDYKGGTRRSLSADRMGQLEYLGRDGKTPAGPNNPPLLVNEGGQLLMVPILVPLSNFQPAPDLRPSGADVPAAPVSSTEPFSATGRIVYQAGAGDDTDSSKELQVENPDGSFQTRLTVNSSSDRLPKWSPDGQRLAFLSDRDGNVEIYVMNVDGSQVTRLTNNPGTDSDPTWSPDGQKIAFDSDPVAMSRSMS